MSASLVPPQPYSTSPDEVFLVTPIPGDLLEDTVSRLRIACIVWIVLWATAILLNHLILARWSSRPTVHW